MLDLIKHFDIASWVTTIGYVGLLLIVLIETGFFFGFFLPGDSLMFTAGLLASKGIFSIWILTPAIIVMAIIGYTIGYWFGDRLGGWLLKRKESFLFKKRYIETANEFYDKHGGKALVIGRLVPIVRTFVPIVAGMATMPYRRYFTYNVLGSLMWGGGITLLGYSLGAMVPNAGHYVLPAVIVIVILSVLPGVIHFLKQR
jgi:membrane-associated protein